MMILKIRRLLIALALAVCTLPTYAQAYFASERSEFNADFDTDSDDVLPSLPETSTASSGREAEIREQLLRAEAARRKGDHQGRLGALRRAHALAGGRHSDVVNLLAGALLQSGDRDGARQAREAFIASDTRSAEKLAHAAALAVLAADEADMARASRWLAMAESLALQLGSGDNELLAQTRLHWARSALLLAQGKFRDSEAEGRLATSKLRELAKATGGRSGANLRYWQDRIDLQLVTALDNLGRSAESESIYHGNLARVTRDTARSLSAARFGLALASSQLRQGRYGEALQQANSVLAELPSERSGQSSGGMADALLVIGWSNTLEGNFSAAITAFEQRAQIMGAAAAGSVVWGYALIRAGRAAEALPMLRAHYAAALRRSPTAYATRERAGMYAYALLRTGRASEAKQLFATALPGLLSARQGRRATDRDDMLLETISNWIIEANLEMMSRDAENGNARAIAQMFRLADVARGSTVQRALALASTRARIDDPELASLARREQDLGNALSARRASLEKLLERPRAQQPQTQIVELRHDIDSSTHERAALRKQITARFPRYARLIEPGPANAADLRKLLKSGEVLVATYTSHDRSYVWAIPQSGAIGFTLAPLGSGELADTVRKLRLALEVGDAPLAAFPVFDTASAYSLYERLLMPLEPTWGRAESLIVVPHGALGQLPLALLPTAPALVARDASFAGYRQVPWLIRRVAIAQLPTVSALAALRTDSPASAATRLAFAGYGDPQFRAPLPAAPATTAARRDLQVRNLRREPPQARDADAGEPSRYAISRLPPLPDTALELREIAATLNASGNDVLLGTDASETNVKQRGLHQYRVLMFATHGLAPGDLEGLTQPALALSNPELTGETDADGLLTMDEVLSLKLAADWVVLSACNTAAGNGAGSEAVSGLGRAFFYAGARALLVSHWPVETVSARLITTGLFRRQSEDPTLTRAQALRRAMLHLIDREQGTDTSGQVRFSYAHPMFWAPFTLVGDAG